MIHMTFEQMYSFMKTLTALVKIGCVKDTADIFVAQIEISLLFSPDKGRPPNAALFVCVTRLVCGAAQ